MVKQPIIENMEDPVEKRMAKESIVSLVFIRKGEQAWCLNRDGIIQTPCYGWLKVLPIIGCCPFMKSFN